MTRHRRAGLVVDGSAPLWLGGLAAFGIVAAHCLAYVIAEPHVHERAMLMNETGHRYWSIIAPVSLGLALAGVAAFLVRTLCPTARPKRVNLFRFAVPRLMGLQLGGFAFLEISERMLIGNGLADVLLERAFIAGIIFQVVVAAVSGLLLCLLAHTLRGLLSEAGAPPARARRILPRPAHKWLQPSLALGTGAGTWRGPPAGF